MTKSDKKLEKKLRMALRAARKAMGDLPIIKPSILDNPTTEDDGDQACLYESYRLAYAAYEVLNIAAGGVED